MLFDEKRLSGWSRRDEDDDDEDEDEDDEETAPEESASAGGVLAQGGGEDKAVGTKAAAGTAKQKGVRKNRRGEPIVCSPDDAYRCFVNSAIDHLVIGNHVLDRERQPARPAQSFELGRD